MLWLSLCGRCMSQVQPRLPPGQQVPCFFIFGDSLVDNGNNNGILTLARANYRPYGIDFPGGATGRFTNGRTYVDALGIITLHFLNSLIKLMMNNEYVRNNPSTSLNLLLDIRKRIDSHCFKVLGSYMHT